MSNIIKKSLILLSIIFITFIGGLSLSLIGKKISIGDSQFQIKDIVPRCIAINVNPNNGNIDLDLLKELMSLNSLSEPSFGVSLNHLGIGNSIKINDEIKLI